ncbi:hypothetical protein [Paracoccus shanxieyensis]|uniref:Uncharacterized protein n=1 Tax=Paracoccus shanxieyensis TaxID=2675752 RepID=A0A6L6IW45_9RHOB|nr:hypothetical protein [Paracoccus shanxieyensis]MTH64725.1 hypothetical protein [Paracoccus shanxieyensis]MTH87869.1 hypothetical protein [Paracoccus shanxieyensis]
MGKAARLLAKLDAVAAVVEARAAERAALFGKPIEELLCPLAAYERQIYLRDTPSEQQWLATMNGTHPYQISDSLPNTMSESDLQTLYLQMKDA